MLGCADTRYKRKGIRIGVGVKSYHGYAGNDVHKPLIMVRTRTLTTLDHHVRHSPDGFNWGYAGSGPADLARSILLDAFGFKPCASYPKECACKAKWVEPCYQEFKDVFIAPLKQDTDWKLEQAPIMDWVFDYFSLSDSIEKELTVVPS